MPWQQWDVLGFHECREVAAVLLLFFDEEIKRVCEKRIVHSASILLSSFEQASPSRAFSQLKLLNRGRDDAAFAFGELKGCAAGYVERGHAAQ